MCLGIQKRVQRNKSPSPFKALGHTREGVNDLRVYRSCTSHLLFISRIANRHQGLKKANLLRLVQAFIISRITYVASFLDLKTERDKLDCIIRKAYKQDLGIPIAASTERLLAMGVHNSFR